MEAAEQKIRLKRKNAYYSRVSIKLIADALMLSALLTFFADEYFFLYRCIPFISLSLLLTFPFIWMGIDSSRVFNLIFTGIGLTLFLTGQFFLGFPWWLSLFILLMLHWRVSLHLEEERDSRFDLGGGYIGTLLIVALISWAYQNIYEKQPPVFVLSIFMFGMLLYTAGTYIVRYIESSEHSKKTSRIKSAKLPIVYSGVLVGFCVLAAVMSKSVSGLLNKGFGWMFWLLSFLIEPIWIIIDWVMGMLPGSVSEGWESLRNSDEAPSEITQEQLQNGGDLSFAWWDEALAGLLLLVIILYVWRSFRNKGWKEEDESRRNAGYSSFKESILPGRGKVIQDVMYSSPDSEVRKSIFMLEKLAEEKKRPRQNGETIQEWFSRMGFQEGWEFYHIYEAARYGDQEIPPDKLALFKQGIERAVNRIEQNEFSKKP
ncbi:hypothetical protein D3H55_17055 [Bacillus salacetis]|uniref:DUF4129 domain-containing protein n=1 Tax=Bacillus salacetis TaxID=2315464 RepID=A0A3A1QTQ8_9BACI|nr:hypothetical protein [Bacillus salacetis]RIW30154.1 hypothetical protein D3H55_17055 [Bacillus salacetis]